MPMPSKRQYNKAWRAFILEAPLSVTAGDLESHARGTFMRIPGSATSNTRRWMAMYTEFNPRTLQACLNQLKAEIVIPLCISESDLPD